MPIVVLLVLGWRLLIVVVIVVVIGSALLENLLSEQHVGGLDAAENVLLQWQWALS